MASDFAARYGPWAVILGASDGTGAAFAREIAARGVNCVLVARRESVLRETGANLSDEFGVECITAGVDLSQAGAADQIIAAVGEREVGLLVNNAGGDPHGARFLEQAVDGWLQLAAINISTLIRCCHHFGGLMRERQRGGLLLIGSGACYGGAGFMATYSGSKAFQLCFAESLWQELRAFEVDVLYMVLGPTDTPSFRRLLEERGKKPPGKLAEPSLVARVGLSRIDKGPLYNWGQRLGLRAGWRRLRTVVISAASRKMVFEQ